MAGVLKNAQLIQEALSIVTEETPILSAISTTFKRGTFRKGDTVEAYIIKKSTVKDLGEAPDQVTADVSHVVLNQHKQIAYEIPYDDVSTAGVDLVQAAKLALARDIGDAFTAAVAENWTAANFPNQLVVPVANAGYDTLVDLRAELVKNKASRMRFGVTSPEYYKAFLSDPIIAANNTNPTNGAVIQDGVIRRQAGFDIFEYADMPDAPLGFFGGRESVLFASAPPVDPSDGGAIKSAGNFSIFTDARSGVSVLAQEYVEDWTLKKMLRIIFLYGSAVGRADSGIRLVSA